MQFFPCLIQKLDNLAVWIFKLYSEKRLGEIIWYFPMRNHRFSARAATFRRNQRLVNLFAVYLCVTRFEQMSAIALTADFSNSSRSLFKSNNLQHTHIMHVFCLQSLKGLTNTCWRKTAFPSSSLIRRSHKNNCGYRVFNFASHPLSWMK